jgi:hypothetical protein
MWKNIHNFKWKTLPLPILPNSLQLRCVKLVHSSVHLALLFHSFKWECVKMNCCGFGCILVDRTTVCVCVEAMCLNYSQTHSLTKSLSECNSSPHIFFWKETNSTLNDTERKKKETMDTHELYFLQKRNKITLDDEGEIRLMPNHPSRPIDQLIIT